MWWHTTLQLGQQRKSFPLFHMGGFGYGSVSLEHDITWDTLVHVVVYPTLSHHIKSLLHISYDVPATMSGTIEKARSDTEKFLNEIDNVEEESFYGYRVEYQYYGKASLAVMLSNPPLTSAALSSNVICHYLCSKDVYIRTICMYVARGCFLVKHPVGLAYVSCAYSLHVSIYYDVC